MVGKETIMSVFNFNLFVFTGKLYHLFVFLLFPRRKQGTLTHKERMKQKYNSYFIPRILCKTLRVYPPVEPTRNSYSEFIFRVSVSALIDIKLMSLDTERYSLEN